jgi:Tol biopolymer transport system component
MGYRQGSFAVRLASIGMGLALLVSTATSDGIEARGGVQWSPPVNLGAELNSVFEESAPHVSSDGLSLYFASTRPDSQGGEDLWVSRRANRHAPWETPANLGPAINTGANERSPALSRNRRLLFFATDRAGGAGGFDIWVSWRPDPADDFGWQPPVNLGTGVNTAATDAGPSFLERGAIPQLYMASARPGGAGGLDIYVASVPGGWAGPPLPVGELSSPQPDLTPAVRPDGLEIVFASGRPGGLGGFDLWRAFRTSLHEPWSTPTHLGPDINTEFLEVFPTLSSDARTLVFQSSRPGGFGGSDLYVSTR